MKPLIPPVETDLLIRELDGHLLRPTNKADNLIYDITAHECPNVMREIARLREIRVTVQADMLFAERERAATNDTAPRQKEIRQGACVIRQRHGHSLV